VRFKPGPEQNMNKKLKQKKEMLLGSIAKQSMCRWYVQAVKQDNTHFGLLS